MSTTRPRLKTDDFARALYAHEQMEECERHLAAAIRCAMYADAPRVAARLKSLRKSIAGGVNHARHRVNRAKRGAPMKRRGIATA